MAETDLRGRAGLGQRPRAGDLPAAPAPAVSELPPRVEAPPKPQDIQSADELYLTGLRVQQIHNPSVDPVEYYREAVRRDAGDSRANLMLGIHYNQRGMYGEAEQHLRRAIERVSTQYTRPKDTEAYFQLGLVLRQQGKLDEAYDQFYRATWDHAWHSAAYHQLAELSCRHGDYQQALEQIDRSLETNAASTKTLGLRAAILRKLDRHQEAREVALSVLKRDPLDFLGMNELYLAHAGVANAHLAGAMPWRASSRTCGARSNPTWNWPRTT